MPERQVEDVVQRALVNAWSQRDQWPPTPFDFERWMFTLAYRRSESTTTATGSAGRS